MTTAYFDCYSGISGDMTLGALVDLGLPIEELKQQLATLNVGGYQISAEHVSRCGIGGTHVKVLLDSEADHHSHDAGHTHEHGHAHPHEHPHTHEHPHERPHAEQPPHQSNASQHSHSHDHPHEHSHTHEHPHSDEHAHPHEHSHSHAPDHADKHAHSHPHHRGFTEIRRIIESSGFSEGVKRRAIEAFHKIAVAEAAVHETTIEEVHFHEVGAVDAIVDIVGAMWGIERLGITQVIASPVAVGSGTVKAAHGVMPVPAPATARLLAGVPIISGAVTGELTTPTGAAIITTLATSFGPFQNFQIEKIGYGSGTRVYPGHANYLRVLLGNQATSQSALPLTRDELLLITTEIDDMPAEVFGHVMERLFALGSLDVHFTPTQMKKNRPGSSLQVLVQPEQKNGIIELLLRETTTFGVKVLPCERYSLRRTSETVQTTFGPVSVKVGYWGNEAIKRTPEYEDCRRLAVENNVPFSDVFYAAATAAREIKG